MGLVLLSRLLIVVTFCSRVATCFQGAHFRLSTGRDYQPPRTAFVASCSSSLSSCSHHLTQCRYKNNEHDEEDMNSEDIPFPLNSSNNNNSNDDDDDDDDEQDSIGSISSASLPLQNTLNRLSVQGVSISPMGFIVLLSTTSSSSPTDTSSSSVISLPIPISIDPNDAHASSSIEALTMIQLLSDIDMAGVAFPPNLLHVLVALQAFQEEEEVHDDDDEDDGHNGAAALIRTAVLKSLPNGVSYYDASSKQRNRIQFPKLQLTGVTLSLPLLSRDENMSKEEINPSDKNASRDQQQSFHKMLHDFWTSTTNTNNETLLPLPLQYTLTVLVDNAHSMDIPLFSQHHHHQHSNCDSTNAFPAHFNCERNYLPLEEACYGYTTASAAFTAIGLALRYKVPIVMDGSSLHAILTTTAANNRTAFLLSKDQPNHDKTISRCLPHWKSTQALQNVNHRVVTNLEEGFELGMLEGALQIAMTKNDQSAVDKIQKAISAKRRQFCDGNTHDDNGDDDDYNTLGVFE
eukprot:CAMPEP_0195510996 /NCGR_PEP_ID=MMETSP0794_2-20130614/3465_1 /TAXON_ID=515487 /ORGANISM="Stephanopyxis turris, Strain CCMP 815" /LENGTH=517 /DNA_ID=CAMNT_0040638525 /DNA_START=263 /DNA_END=1816 /DNA_ORIENTATION=-